MKIIKVVVDELPSSCIQCIFLKKIYCMLEDDKFVGKFPEPCPDWCPLITAQDDLDNFMKPIADYFTRQLNWESEDE